MFFRLKYLTSACATKARTGVDPQMEWSGQRSTGLAFRPPTSNTVLNAMSLPDTALPSKKRSSVSLPTLKCVETSPTVTAIN